MILHENQFFLFPETVPYISFKLIGDTFLKGKLGLIFGSESASFSLIHIKLFLHLKMHNAS